jgi:hypothetical protein
LHFAPGVLTVFQRRVGGRFRWQDAGVDRSRSVAVENDAATEDAVAIPAVRCRREATGSCLQWIISGPLEWAQCMFPETEALGLYWKNM